VEPRSEDGIAEDYMFIKEQQVGAIAECEAIVQNIWEKFETKEHGAVGVRGAPEAFNHV
jgi:hypothetical protein